MITDLDRVMSPQTWPDPPKMVSFSVMSDIEECPRRWALSHASYPGIWDRSGYPRRVGYGNARGDIVHSAVERLVKTLIESGCSTLRSKEAVTQIKNLGGFTRIVDLATETFIQEQRRNPRMENTLQDLERRLAKETHSHKSLVQEMLVRIEFEGRSPEAVIEGKRGDSDKTETSRRPLGLGSHSEVFLRSDDIGWMGIADLITIGTDLCEIRDFKTGGEEDYHQDQLRTYAALWHQDKLLNPASRVANQLTLSYPGRDYQIPPPTIPEINQISADLTQRGDAARLALAENPSKAIPSAANCQWCSVKHLCDEYWLESTQKSIFGEAEESNRYIDSQVHLDDRTDSLLWQGTADCAGNLDKGTRVTVMLQTPDENLQVGQTIRILGSMTRGSNNTNNQDDGPPLIEFVSSTERFMLS